MRLLHTWIGGHLLGDFSEDDQGNIDFTYADPNPPVPVSLSLLPEDEGLWPKEVPRNFLEGLLPTGGLRESMARKLGVGRRDLFSLLDGADSEGGLVFTLSDHPHPREAEGADFATDDSIAYEIRCIVSNPGDSAPLGPHTRFFLNGNQPKFTLEYAPSADPSSPDWIWPSAAFPSTHILKPPMRPSDRRDVPEIEAASSKLAALAGMDVTGSGIMRFRDAEAFVIERYDRTINDDGTITRIHAEDMLQALGVPVADKYHVSVMRILSLLHRVDPTDTLSYQWIRQLAFNVSIANADAHAQNYSILISPYGIRLAPMYDLLTTAYWPDVEKSLAMHIGWADDASDVSPESWRNLARHNGLDPDRVEEIARTVAGRVLAAAPEAYKDLDPRIRDRALSIIQQANKRIEPIFSNVQSFTSPQRKTHKHHKLSR